MSNSTGNMELHTMGNDKTMMELFDSEEELSEHVAEMLAQNPDFLIEPHPELNGKTILYEAVKREKVSAVKVLLESGADPRQMNEKFGKFPIHVAAEKANKKILGLLLEHMNGPTEIDVNVQDLKMSRTPLHELLRRIAKKPEEVEAKDCIVFLLDYKPPLHFNFELLDGADQTVISLATETTGLAWLVDEFVKRFQDNGRTLDEIVVRMIRERSETVVGSAPRRAPLLIQNHIEDSQDPDMWNILETGNEILFHEHCLGREWPTNHWNSSNGSMTFLQLACWEENTSIVRDLLDLGADPNLTTHRSCNPPALIAAKSKNLEILKLLATTEETEFTQRVELALKEASKCGRKQPGESTVRHNILHLLLSCDEDMWTSKNMSPEAIERTYNCLKFLLENVRCLGRDKDTLVNEESSPKKQTPLHLATDYPCQMFCSLLLEHGAEKSLFVSDTFGVKPVSGMLVSTLREYLDSCVQFEGGPMDSKFKITFQSNVLIPMRKYFKRTGDTESLVDQEMGTSSAGFDSGREFCYSDNECRDGVPEMEFMTAMSAHHDYRDLFDHPVITSMIWIKWTHFKDKNHWIHLFLYLRILTLVVYLAFVHFTFSGAYTGVRMGIANDACMSEMKTNPTPAAKKMQLQMGFIPFNCYPLGVSNTFRYLAIVLAFLAFLKIFFRFAFLIRLSFTVTMANLKFLLRPVDFKVRIILIVVAPFLLLAHPANERLLTFEQSRDLAGFFAVFCCIDICFLIRDFLPWRGLASMLNWTLVVSGSIFSFLAIHSFLFLGFGFAFYIQLHSDSPLIASTVAENASKNETEENVFSGGARLPLKILAMFVGELEYGDHPFHEGFAFNYVVFAMFVFFIVIVMMNLLTTVAILDVQEIMNKSNDESWMTIAKHVNYWEQALMRLVPISGYFRRLKRSLYAFNPNHTIVCYPNEIKNKGKVTELVVREAAVVKEAKNICIERMKRMEETLHNVTNGSGSSGSSLDDNVSTLINAVQRRLSVVESRLLAGTRSVRETKL